MAGGAALGRALKRIKEQFHAVPDNGLGFGLLRYLNPQTASQLAGFARPQIGFNYLGRFPAAAATDWAGAAEAGAPGGGGEAAMRLAHALEVNAITLDGSAGATLCSTWSWPPALMAEAQVRALAQGWFAALEALVRHAAAPAAGGRTPCDLPLVSLSQAEIERLEQHYPQIEDILPLSPLQEGLLFHALYDAQGPDVYTSQLVLGLEGALDPAALQVAARALLVRHSSLRAGFQHENLMRPVQIIVRSLPPPWRTIDLSMLDDAGGAARVAEILAQDRAEHFDLSAPPLLRFTLIRLAADRHRLLLTFHHILLDGWSMPVLVRELLALYAHAGDAAVLPAVTPYRDYLAWLARQDRAAATAAWREALAGLEEATLVAPPAAGRELVALQPLVVTLSETLSTALSQAARSRGLTLNTYVQGAWAILLGRLTGRDDVVFGVTVAGRPPEVAGIETMVGLFINTLPLRLELPPGLPLRDLLAQLQERQSALMAHQHLGLAEIQGLAGLGELFDTLVVFENYPVDHASLAAEAGGLRLAEIVGHDATHYSLSLVAAPGERLELRLDYRPDLFERASVAALAERLIRLLEAAVGEPDRALGSLDILSAADRDTIMREWNDTARAIACATLPDLFAAQVAETPDAIAVVFEDQSLTYAELNGRANQLAHHLRGLGVGPEVVVGLCLERAPAMVVGLIGILKAGGAYLPLDPDYPPDRLAFMLDDAAAPVLVTQAALRARIPAHNTKIVCLDADGPAIARFSTTALPHRLQPQNTAYVIYTSGSTGTPKGVAALHQGVISFTQSSASWSASATTIHNAPLAFDASTFEIWGPLLSGAKLVLMPPGQWTLADLQRQIQLQQVSLLQMTAALFNALVPDDYPSLAGLEQLFTGSDVVSHPQVRNILTASHDFRFVHTYGPTETTTFCITFSADGPQEVSQSLPIGRPLWNTRVYVLDGGLEPVPAGVTGELY